MATPGTSDRGHEGRTEKNGRIGSKSVWEIVRGPDPLPSSGNGDYLFPLCQHKTGGLFCGENKT